MTDAARRIELEGPVNFRDLGGYAGADGRAVRRRHLYRSDALHLLTETDVVQIRALGVRTVIDFRTTFELDSNGPGGIELLGAQHVHLPTFDTTRPLAMDEDVVRALVSAPDAYMAMLRIGAGTYANAVRRVADAEDPLVFFCAAGKDRTGVFAAFVLGLLGVSDDDIVDDYALTGEVIAAFEARGHFKGFDDETRAARDRIGEDLRHAFPESMARTLERVRGAWGDWHGYAESIGVDRDTVDRLRDRLLVS